MGLLVSIARKFKEYRIRHQLGNVFSKESDENREIIAHGDGYSLNSNAYEVSQLRMSATNGIMEALTDANINLIGVCGSESSEKSTLLEKVSRKAKRDNLFDMVVMATVTKKPDLKRIQEEISQMLGLKFDKEKDLAERACCLCGKIKEQQKILIVLQDLWKSLDLDKVGIPFGANHRGCKILLTSSSEEILSNQMHTQENFYV